MAEGEEDIEVGGDGVDVFLEEPRM